MQDEKTNKFSKKKDEKAIVLKRFNVWVKLCTSKKYFLKSREQSKIIQNYPNGAFRTQSNIWDGDFSQKQSTND